MTVRRKNDKIRNLQLKFKNKKNVQFNSKMENKDDLYSNDILITDWSGISWEFSLMLGKPTLFVNTPMKIMNQNYFKFENKPYEIELREKIGFIYNVNELKNIVDKINSPNFINEFKSKLKNIKY